MATSSLVLLLSGLVACGDKDDGDSATGTANQAPIADAGADVSGSGTTRIAVNGGGSYDPDGDPLVWQWSFDTVPAASSIDTLAAPFSPNGTADAALTSFLPDAAGVYVVKLVVEDASGARSNPDFVVVTVEEGDVPVANAGPDQTGDAGAAFTLDGSSSYDPLGRDLRYDWTLVSKPESSDVEALTGSNTATPTFEADVGGVYVASLVVNNGFSDSSADAVFVYVSTGVAAAPVAVAGEDIKDGQDCSDLVVDGSDSFDPNGDPLDHLWTLQSKPEGSAANNYSFADRSAATTTFYPDISGTYVFSLAVNDGSEWSTPDELTAVVAERWANTEPQVEAGAEITINAGTALCSEGSYSTWECGTCDPVSLNIGTDASVTDAESDPYTVLWTEGEGSVEFTGPTDAVQTQVYLTGASPEEADACAVNVYTAVLSATDCPQDVGTDTLTINVVCCGEEYRRDTGR